MQYRDLIKFEPIESVVQLKDANSQEKAEKLLSTYVISENMADKINLEIIENLQFERPVDNKGMLIVGNYGTGKSHLMSVISTLAEMKDSSKHLRNQDVAEKAKEIEGNFKVIRAEFGAVKKSLRDIVCDELENGLANMGVNFSFPAVDQVNNNKDMFFEMMDLFQQQYPDKGLLLVIDELLDYLRGRKDQDLTLDLGFLREIGEVCSKSRFRFISGVQEMLFDNPKFHYVADSLRRVKERFREVRIVREDIAYVVSERLLQKDSKQKALIREHLSKFTEMYHGLAENMDNYVAMFPIHPNYLETFEKISIGEKRIALQTVSYEIKSLLNKEVPDYSTGFISFDSYWSFIEADSSLRTNDQVKSVMTKVQTLKNVMQASVRKTYHPIANQLINALAVYRLTTDDLKTPVGLTSEALRDNLFVSHPMLLEMEDAEFLTDQIKVSLKQVRNAASFQFLSLNEDNGQYYIDIDKAIAVDDLIKNRGDELNDDNLDRYYFSALKEALHVSAEPSYVDGYRIWLHELPWREKKVKREGYLFLGAPNERSTAQPERDFYLYLLQPFNEPKFKNEKREDEIFFRLKGKDEEFVRLLRLFGGATEMYNDSTNKNHYKPKRDDYFKQLVKYLRDHFVNMFEVSYMGKVITGEGHGGLFSTTSKELMETIDSISENPFAPWFRAKYPDYPAFNKLDEKFPLTKKNLKTYVEDAFKVLNGARSAQGTAILDGLKLIDGYGKIDIKNSIYVQWVLELLNQKGAGQVVNQNELIEVIYTAHGTEDFRLAKRFVLEPELLSVVLGALIITGDVVLSINGTNYDATNLPEFLRLNLTDKMNFNHIKKPTGLPVASLQALIEMFDAPNVEMTNNLAVEKAIKTIIERTKKEINKVIKMKTNVRTKFQTWEGQLFKDTEKSEKLAKLDSLDNFLQELQRFDSRAKMINLKFDVAKIQSETENLKLVSELESLQQKLNEYVEIAHYLQNAKRTLSLGTGWNSQLDSALSELSDALKTNGNVSKAIEKLEGFKGQYIDFYFDEHQKYRLTATEDNKKNSLVGSSDAKGLRVLADSITLLPKQTLTEWQQKMYQLTACYQLNKTELTHSAECPHCHFNNQDAKRDKKTLLKNQEAHLNHLKKSWAEMLEKELDEPTSKESIQLLPSSQKQLIQQFQQDKAFIFPIQPAFIDAVNTALKGIHKKEIELEEILKLFGNGKPVSIKDIRQEVSSFLRSISEGSDENTIRIEVKKSDDR